MFSLVYGCHTIRPILKMPPLLFLIRMFKSHILKLNVAIGCCILFQFHFKSFLMSFKFLKYIVNYSHLYKIIKSMKSFSLWLIKKAGVRWCNPQEYALKWVESRRFSYLNEGPQERFSWSPMKIPVPARSVLDTGVITTFASRQMEESGRGTFEWRKRVPSLMYPAH